MPSGAAIDPLNILILSSNARELHETMHPTILLRCLLTAINREYFDSSSLITRFSTILFLINHLLIYSPNSIYFALPP
jgi:hypothetical protein